MGRMIVFSPLIIKKRQNSKDIYQYFELVENVDNDETHEYTINIRTKY